MRGMLSGFVQPQPSTAVATWAKGIESSLTLTSDPVYLHNIPNHQTGQLVSDFPPAVQVDGNLVGIDCIDLLEVLFAELY